MHPKGTLCLVQDFQAFGNIIRLCFFTSDNYGYPCFLAEMGNVLGDLGLSWKIVCGEISKKLSVYLKLLIPQLHTGYCWSMMSSVNPGKGIISAQELRSWKLISVAKQLWNTFAHVANSSNSNLTYSYSEVVIPPNIVKIVRTTQNKFPIKRIIWIVSIVLLLFDVSL